jgi:hypothetical protein
MWTKLNQVMLRFGLEDLDFKGFMVDNTHANWNVVYIVYGFEDASMKMVDKEQTYMFHWTQLLDRHIKQLITSKLQERHKALCFEYKNATSLE